MLGVLERVLEPLRSICFITRAESVPEPVKTDYGRCTKTQLLFQY